MGNIEMELELELDLLCSARHHQCRYFLASYRRRAIDEFERYSLDRKDMICDLA